MVGKISCQIITKDDSATLEACLASIRPHVDELVIVDTGSTDRTPEIARKYADKFEVWLGANDPATGLIEDFAAARNYAADLGTCEWMFWADGDDVVQGAEHLRAMTERTEDMVCYITPYAYDFDAGGRCTTLHHRERLMRPAHLWRWQTPVHEVCLPVRHEGTFASLPDQRIAHIHHKHLSRKAHEPGRNLRILKKYIAKNGEGDIRALYYFGSELCKNGQIGEGIGVLRRYAELANWTDEKCLALLALGQCQAIIGDFETAIDWALRALITKSWPEPYFALGKYFYSIAQREWVSQAQKVECVQKCISFLRRGLAMPDTNTVLFVNPQEKYEVQKFLNVCLMMVGDLEGATKACEDGLVGLAGDPELSKNLEIYRAEKHRRTVMASLQSLAESKAITPEAVQLMHGVLAGQVTIGGGQPPLAQVSQPPALLPLPVEIEAATPAEGKLDVALYIGHQLEPWSPKTLIEGGMGGSETMAWEMARRLVAQGHAVRMYSHATPSMEGIYEGVRYLDASRFKGIKCDVLIASRQPWAVDREYGCEARARVLWVHDVHCGEALNQERDLRFDRILCLSEWHKTFFLACYPRIAPEKVIVTRNGVDLGRFFGPLLPEKLEPGPVDSAPPAILDLAQHPLAPGIPRYEVPGTRIIIGGSIGRAEDWASLEAHGVTHVISVTDPPDVGVPPERVLHFHVNDDGTPFPAERMRQVVDFAHKALSGGGKLYVHCWVGASRSPSFVYLILRAIYRMTPTEAQAAIQKNYPFPPEDLDRENKRRIYRETIEKWLAGPAVTRNAHRAIYSSSPDRGLKELLELWPLVRAEVPDAELGVYYGFGNWEKTNELTGDEAGKRKVQHLKHLVRTTPGVTLNDRVCAAELGKAFLGAGVWAYPTWFTETSCCHPDTRISVPGDHTNGTPTVRIADMVGRAPFPVYAFNEAENRFQIATCTKVWETKIADELVALELDSGETLRVTPDHLVLTFDGDWVEAGTLKPGDSLRALHYRYNVAIRDGNGRWTDEHRLVAEWKEGRRIARGEHVNHLDPRRLNNLPEMLDVLTAAEHFSRTHKGKRLSRRHVEKKRLATMAAIAAMSPERKIAWHAAGGRANAERLRRMDPQERDAMWADRAAKRKATIARKKAGLPYELRDGHNHKVVSVARIPGPVPVYDMEVEGLHNFVADGIVIHNCITAMEAQAAGCRIVTSPLAALNETVGDRGDMVPGHETNPNTPGTEAYRRAFAAAVVRAMTDPEGKDRAALQEYARGHFGLETLAAEWDAMLLRIVAEVEASVVPAFNGVAA